MKVHILANVIYHKYHQLGDARKELFRGMILAAGTKLCLDAFKEKDLTKVKTILCSTAIDKHLMMMSTIEMRDRCNSEYDENIELEIAGCMVDFMACPCQTIRFFHRRISCDCLQETYYILKEITKKTSY